MTIIHNLKRSALRITLLGTIPLGAAENPDSYELKLRAGVRFQNGETFTAEHIKINFDQMQQWAAPHPPGTWLNFPPESVAEVVDDLTLRFHFPGPDGLAIGKMRGFHITSKEFWGPNGPGFGYKKFGSGDGHW